VSIKRKSPAGKLAQAVYDAWMVQQNGCAARPFPKTGFSGDASQWAVIGTAALEHLREEYGIDLELSATQGNAPLKLSAGAPMPEIEDRPDTWPVGTPVRVGELTGKIARSPRRVRVQFERNARGNQHSGEFLAKFVHRAPEAGEAQPPPAAETARAAITPATPLGVNRMAVYCDDCDFYRESWRIDGHRLLFAGEQHHRENGTHTVRVKRNPEETRETVTM
jgi:hypothetical protein